MFVSLRPFKGQSLLPMLTFALMGTLWVVLVLLGIVFSFPGQIPDQFVRNLFIFVPSAAFVTFLVIHVCNHGLTRWPNEINIPFERSRRFDWVKRLEDGVDLAEGHGSLRNQRVVPRHPRQY